MIQLKSPIEIEKMRKASRYAMEILQYVGNYVQEGAKTIELEKICEQKLREAKDVKPAFKGYNGFPYCLCVSIDSEVVHGMPGEHVLREGEIVSIDFGILHDGFFGDVAITFPVGKIAEDVEHLLNTTRQSLYDGIDRAREGNRLYDISHAIQTRVEAEGFSVVREFVGHGIGRELHEEPQLPNYGQQGRGIRLRQGMTFAIEPMVNMGKSEIYIDENGWTAVTKDKSLSAHFEHTVAITDKGPEILSLL